MTVGDNVMYFNYDASGVPVSIVYNGTTYYYVTNLQGDIVGIVNQSGNKIVSYTYDAWGNILTTTGTSSTATLLAERNPLRYRGYVYDTESRLYYLQSRYYDPEMGRFISADSYTSTGQGILGNNMFAYCGNSPVNGSDPCGTCFHRWDFWNDCERCGGRTAITKLDNFATMVVDYQAIVREDQRKQTELQLGLVKTMIDIQVRTEQAVADQQRMQDILVGDFVVDRFSTPEKASESLGIIALGLDVAAHYTKSVLPTGAAKISGIAWTVRAIATVISLFD